MQYLIHKKSLFLFFIIASLLMSIPLSAGELIFLGHEALGKGKYDEALKYYGQAKKEGYKWAWLPEMIETVEKRKKLGKIKPEYTQNICVIYVTQINYLKKSGGVNRPRF